MSFYGSFHDEMEKVAISTGAWRHLATALFPEPSQPSTKAVARLLALKYQSPGHLAKGLEEGLANVARKHPDVAFNMRTPVPCRFPPGPDDKKFLSHLFKEWSNSPAGKALGPERIREGMHDLNSVRERIDSVGLDFLSLRRKHPCRSLRPRV